MKRRYLLDDDPLVHASPTGADGALILWRHRQRDLSTVEVSAHRDGYQLLLTVDGRLLGVQLSRALAGEDALELEVSLDAEEARLFGLERGFSHTLKAETAAGRRSRGQGRGRARARSKPLQETALF